MNWWSKEMSEKKGRKEKMNEKENNETEKC